MDRTASTNPGLGFADTRQAIIGQILTWWDNPSEETLAADATIDARKMRPGDHILIDLDGTLAHFDHWRGSEHIGEPIPAMLARVKAWRAAGIEVRIFTARVSDPDPIQGTRYADVLKAHDAIEAWCLKHLGEVLPITCEKSFQCAAIYDDRAFQVVANEGRIVSSATGGVE
jgi:hypothetical protein